MDKYIQEIVRPKKDSHKGENGRVLVIGGSKLFHAASFWAACMAAKIVDMVHFSSPTLENNELMRSRAKEKFWDGIVVPWEEIDHYIEEDDAILIGPGMERGEETREIVNHLLAKYPEKRWVVDGGALQEVDIALLKPHMIVTPNKKEYERLSNYTIKLLDHYTIKSLDHCTILYKGVEDVITGIQGEKIVVSGGSVGMTKGGTGDVLAGIVVGLYAKSSAFASCVVSSQANKRAGEVLESEMGTYFSAIDLIPQVQRELGKMLDMEV